MECKIAQKHVLMRHSRTWTTADEESFVQHMKTCAACRAFADDIERIRNDIQFRRHHAQVGPSPETMGRIRDEAKRAVGVGRDADRFKRVHVWSYRPLTWAAAAMFAIVLVGWQWTQRFRDHLPRMGIAPVAVNVSAPTTLPDDEMFADVLLFLSEDVVGVDHLAERTASDPLTPFERDLLVAEGRAI